MRSEDRVDEELRSERPEERRSPKAKECLAWAGAFVMACCLALPQAATAATGTVTWNSGDSYTITCQGSTVTGSTNQNIVTPGSGVTATSAVVQCVPLAPRTAAQVCQSWTANGQTACAAAGCAWYPQFTTLATTVQPTTWGTATTYPAAVYPGKCDIAGLVNYPPTCTNATSQAACQIAAATLSPAAAVPICKWQPSACPAANSTAVPCGGFQQPACTTPPAVTCSIAITTGTCVAAYTKP